MVDATGPGRCLDRHIRTNHARAGFDEDERLGRQRLVLLERMILIVEADADDLRRLNRREDLRALAVDLRGLLELAERVALDQPPASLSLRDR